jgi:hypothetical protein
MAPMSTTFVPVTAAVRGRGGLDASVASPGRSQR